MTITGRTIGQEIDALPPPFPQKIMRPLHNPIFPASALAVLRGNLSPNGCIIKQSAMEASLRRHTGKALVFESSADLAARIDDPNLEVDATNVYVHFSPVSCIVCLMVSAPYQTCLAKYWTDW